MGDLIEEMNAEGVKKWLVSIPPTIQQAITEYQSAYQEAYNSAPPTKVEALVVMAGFGLDRVKARTEELKTGDHQAPPKF